MGLEQCGSWSISPGSSTGVSRRWSFRWTFAYAALLATIGCARHAEPVNAPEGWERYDMQSFSFWAPTGMTEAPVRPVDSYVRQFTGNGMVLTFDYGRFSNSLDGAKRSHNESIDGRVARLASYDNEDPKAAVNGFPFGHWEAAYFRYTSESDMRLTMLINCEGASSCRDAQQVLRTVRFGR